MPKTKKTQKPDTPPERRWSARSQGWLRERHRLRTALARQQCLAESCKHSAAVLNKKIDDKAIIQAREGPILQSGMANDLVDLQAVERQLKAHEAEIANLEAQLKKMEEASVSGQGERAKNQEALATLLRARLATDAQLAAAIDAVSALLHQRDQETRKMLECSKLLDLTLVQDGLDTMRFEALLHALPENLLLRSQAWVTWFLGERRETRPFLVSEETVTVPETLMCAGFYKRGECMELTTEEHARLFPPKATTSKAEAEAALLAPAPRGDDVDRYWAGEKL